MNSDSLKSKPRNCLRSMQAQLTQHAGQCAQRRLGPKVIDVRGDSRYRILQRWDSSAGTQHQPHVAEEKRDQPPAALESVQRLGRLQCTCTAAAVPHLNSGLKVATGKSVSSSVASWRSLSSEPRTSSLASPDLSTTYSQSNSEGSSP
jgi:hypothetical protein